MCLDFDWPFKSSSVMMVHMEAPFSLGIQINVLVSADASMDF
jgi:hypothetical protein